MDKATNTPSAKAAAAPPAARMNFGTIVVLVALFGILAVASWYAARAWISVDGPPMPATGYVAMTLGVVFSLLVGCGLMALLFYSSRHCYDERAGAEQTADPDDGERG
jgi:hypothetical protein